MGAVGEIEAAIGHAFEDRTLLTEALTHSSYAAEHPGAVSYERLEFLGDAVLELATTSLIYDAMEGEPEGAMTKVRASVVDEATLASVARSWRIPDGLRLGVGEERSGGRDRDSILSDAAEAVIAAVYLDAGAAVAFDVVTTTWLPLIEDRMGATRVIDPRSELQEALAREGRHVLFEFARSGPDHDVVFTATAIVDGAAVGVGTGGSKKAAAIAAASAALAGGVAAT